MNGNFLTNWLPFKQYRSLLEGTGAGAEWGKEQEQEFTRVKPVQVLSHDTLLVGTCSIIGTSPRVGQSIGNDKIATPTRQGGVEVRVYIYSPSRGTNRKNTTLTKSLRVG